MTGDRVVVGTIHYPLDDQATQKGVFVYIKPALAADSAVDLHSYRARHPEFPHEATTDQFFGEAQFEAYRELGYCSGDSAATLLNRELDIRCEASKKEEPGISCE